MTNIIIISQKQQYKGNSILLHFQLSTALRLHSLSTLKIISKWAYVYMSAAFAVFTQQNSVSPQPDSPSTATYPLHQSTQGQIYRGTCPRTHPKALVLEFVIMTKRKKSKRHEQISKCCLFFAFNNFINT